MAFKRSAVRSRLTPPLVIQQIFCLNLQIFAMFIKAKNGS